MSRPSLAFARQVPLVALMTMIVACGSAGGEDGTGGKAGLATVFDSTSPDSIVARTVGTVPPARVRRLVDEMRIAPSADDTSLFGDVSEVEVGLDGRIYAFDYTANTLFLFDSAGSLVRRIGRKGAGPGEFNSGNGMVVLRDGRVAIWDAGNARISFFSAAGELATSLTITSGFSTNDGLRTDSSGALLIRRPVTGPREGEILGRMGLVRIRDDGSFGDSLIPPDLPVERIAYIAESNGGRAQYGPMHAANFLWAWHPDGYFVSANGGKAEIEVSRAAPLRPLRIVRDAAPVSVSAEERAWDQERITIALRRNVPGWAWTGPAIPDTKPPINRLSVTRDGTIWARVATPSERIPESELEPQLPNRLPRAIFREASAYEVFGADGRFLGRVGFPPRSTLIDAAGSTVWLLQRDADGLPMIVRTRVEPALR
ncbi:MAG: 6-bladed beta-propeller [Gemmatimonadaceae bacterium]